MALPLPRIVPDVGPGGGLVTAMGGMNALGNNMLLRDINRVKAQYAPLTTQAEALSKLAYANLMGPQFLAKAINNPGFLANLNEDQKKAVESAIYRAGSGQGNGFNAMNTIPSFPENNGSISQSSNPFAWIGHKLKAAFDHKPQVNAINAQPQFQNTPPQSNNIPAPNQPIEQRTHQDETGETDESRAYEDWLNSPEGQREVAKGDKANIPDKNQILKRYYDKMSKTPIDLTLKEGQKGKHEPTYAEKTGQHLGVIEEGKESGKNRATSRKELDQEYQQALQLKAPFQKLNSIISNPVFQKLRQLPGFQKLQMDTKAQIGNKEEQKLIGEFQAAARNVVAATVKGFGGRILASEIPLSESMKISEKDPIGVMLGKAPVIEEFNEFTLQRARLASKLMKEYHLDKGEALEKADKLVDGKAIRRQIDNELNPISEEDIDYTAKQNGINREDVIKRLKSEGRYNG